MAYGQLPLHMSLGFMLHLLCTKRNIKYEGLSGEPLTSVNVIGASVPLPLRDGATGCRCLSLAFDFVHRI